MFCRSATTGTRRTAFFIAYHYPPIHSTGVERTAKFLRYLAEFGYRASLLTTSAFGDIAASSDLPEVRVLRAWEPLKLYRWLFNGRVRSGRSMSFERTDPGDFGAVLGALRRFALVPDGQLTWLPAALLRSLRFLRRHPADILYSTYPPASAHLIALLLKQITGLPWVADFRDAWTYDPLDPVLEEMPYRLALEKRLEEAVVCTADAVIAATQVSAAYLRETYPQAASGVRIITNGFEPEDFPSVESSPKSVQQDPLCIVHTGSFSHSHPRRTPQPLFAALESLLDEDPAWAGRVHLLLVGHLSPQERAAGARLEQAGVVEIAGSRKREEALEFQRQADILLLVDHSRQWPASNVPAKFYEYLAMQRPILALSGSGMVEQLMRELQAGYHAAADDPQAIREVLIEVYGEFCQGRLHGGVDAVALRPFHRRVLAEKLAHCFDDLLTR